MRLAFGYVFACVVCGCHVRVAVGVSVRCTGGCSDGSTAVSTLVSVHVSVHRVQPSRICISLFSVVLYLSSALSLRASPRSKWMVVPIVQVSQHTSENSEFPRSTGAVGVAIANSLARGASLEAGPQDSRLTLPRSSKTQDSPFPRVTAVLTDVTAKVGSVTENTHMTKSLPIRVLQGERSSLQKFRQK